MSLETINFHHLHLNSGERVLDVGCGEGRHSISAYLTADVHVTGIDLNAQDLATARTRLEDFGSYSPTANKSCTFIEGSGLALPFPDNHFDKVICSEVLEHVPDYNAMLGEIKRVLKPGGIFAASVPSFFPEWVCWQLSDAYHEEEGGHIRIFTNEELHHAVRRQGMRRFARHRAHSLHVPYWWLKCLFWNTADTNPLIHHYHRFLVWDLMQKPELTRLLDRLLNPVLGKSTVMYFENES